MASIPGPPLFLIRCRRRFWFLLHRSTALCLTSAHFLAKAIRRLRGPGGSSDPYAGVRVPKRPLIPRRSASIALDEPN